MKFDLRPSALLFSLFVGCASSGFAQRQESVSVLVDLVAWGNAIEGISLKSNSKQETITALPFTYSESIAYKGPPILEIFQSGKSSTKEIIVSAEDEEHLSQPLTFENEKIDQAKLDKADPLVKELFRRREEEPNLVALVRLPKGSKRATILLAPAEGGTLQPYVIDDDPRKLPAGKLRVHNLSPFEIGLRFAGRQGAELKPGTDALVNAQNQVVAYELNYKKDDRWVTQENNLIPVRESEQTKMIILKSNNQYFLSSDGASGGFLQVLTLRRAAN